MISIPKHFCPQFLFPILSLSVPFCPFLSPVQSLGTGLGTKECQWLWHRLVGKTSLCATIFMQSMYFSMCTKSWLPYQICHAIAFSKIYFVLYTKHASPSLTVLLVAKQTFFHILQISYYLVWYPLNWTSYHTVHIISNQQVSHESIFSSLVTTIFHFPHSIPPAFAQGGTRLHTNVQLTCPIVWACARIIDPIFWIDLHDCVQHLC